MNIGQLKSVIDLSFVAKYDGVQNFEAFKVEIDKSVFECSFEEFHFDVTIDVPKQCVRIGLEKKTKSINFLDDIGSYRIIWPEE